MRYLIFFLLYSIASLSIAQESTLGSNTSINIGSDASFHTGGGLVLEGVVENEGIFGVKGDAIVDGTLLNASDAESYFIGDMVFNSPFTNNGTFIVLGAAIFSESLVNTKNAVFSGSTTFDNIITNDANLFLGDDAVFKGAFTNNSKVISYANAQLDFVDNRSLGTLNFVDLPDSAAISEVVLLSNTDSIFIEILNLDTKGVVTLPSNFVVVETELNIESGVLNATNQESFLVKGTINVDDQSDSPSYVEGTLLAVTTTEPTTFPMGINGFPNYFTMSGDKAGIVVKVECILPNPDSLLTDEETLGLSEEVEWRIRTLSEDVDVNVSVDYSGIDFSQAPNFINAREYDVTLQKFADGDSVFSPLLTKNAGSKNNNGSGNSVLTEGAIKTSGVLMISTKPTRFALGFSPVLIEPELYLPNVFSPQAQFSDNKIFRPFVGGTIISSVSFSVFDSFNRQVYEASLSGKDVNLEDIGWDGTLNSGLEAPEGVYYYSVSIDYTMSDEVSDKYFNTSAKSKVRNFNKLGSVMLVK